MKTLSKNDAINLLQKIISERENLPKVGGSNSDRLPWRSWKRTCLLRVQRVFGIGSSQVGEVETLLSRLDNDVGSAGYAQYKFSSSEPVIYLLQSMIVEVMELWDDDPPTAVSEELSTREEQQANRTLEPLPPDSEISSQVFIVHGHDHGRLQTVARFLERLKLTVLILHERPNEGATIIEKLETHGNPSFAVVLLTPDDVGSVATQSDKLKPRARQNVVLELGYFLARLGRRRVAALVIDGVELPSDFSGVVYINLDDQGAWQFHLAKELKAAGLPIDGDALL